MVKTILHVPQLITYTKAPGEWFKIESFLSISDYKSLEGH